MIWMLTRSNDKICCQSRREVIPHPAMTKYQRKHSDDRRRPTYAKPGPDYDDAITLLRDEVLPK